MLVGYIEGALVDRADGRVELACTPAYETRICEPATQSDTYRRLGRATYRVTIGRGSATEVLSAQAAREIAARLVEARSRIPRASDTSARTDPALVAETVLSALGTAGA